MRPRRALSLVLIALLAGCGGGGGRTTTASHHVGKASIPKECARLLEEARAKLPAPKAGEIVGQMNEGCASTRVRVPLDNRAQQAMLRRLASAFSTVAGHRIDLAVGYSCVPPPSMRAGALVACSVTTQKRRGELRYAVRLAANGCWRAISLSSGPDLAGCKPSWTG